MRVASSEEGSGGGEGSGTGGFYAWKRTSFSFLLAAPSSCARPGSSQNRSCTPAIESFGSGLTPRGIILLRASSQSTSIGSGKNKNEGNEVNQHRLHVDRSFWLRRALFMLLLACTLSSCQCHNAKSRPHLIEDGAPPRPSSKSEDFLDEDLPVKGEPSATAPHFELKIGATRILPDSISGMLPGSVRHESCDLAIGGSQLRIRNNRTGRELDLTDTSRTHELECCDDAHAVVSAIDGQTMSAAVVVISLESLSVVSLWKLKETSNGHTWGLADVILDGDSLFTLVSTEEPPYDEEGIRHSHLGILTAWRIGEATELWSIPVPMRGWFPTENSNSYDPRSSEPVDVRRHAIAFTDSEIWLCGGMEGSLFKVLRESGRVLLEVKSPGDYCFVQSSGAPHALIRVPRSDSQMIQIVAGPVLCRPSQSENVESVLIVSRETSRAGIALLAPQYSILEFDGDGGIRNKSLVPTQPLPMSWKQLQAGIFWHCHREADCFLRCLPITESSEQSTGSKLRMIWFAHSDEVLPMGPQVEAFPAKGIFEISGSLALRSAGRPHRMTKSECTTITPMIAVHPADMRAVRFTVEMTAIQSPSSERPSLLFVDSVRISCDEIRFQASSLRDAYEFRIPAARVQDLFSK